MASIKTLPHPFPQALRDLLESPVESNKLRETLYKINPILKKKLVNHIKYNLESFNPIPEVDVILNLLQDLDVSGKLKIPSEYKKYFVPFRWITFKGYYKDRTLVKNDYK